MSTLVDRIHSKHWRKLVCVLRHTASHMGRYGERQRYASLPLLALSFLKWWKELNNVCKGAFSILFQSKMLITEFKP